MPKVQGCVKFIFLFMYPNFSKYYARLKFNYINKKIKFRTETFNKISLTLSQNKE